MKKILLVMFSAFFMSQCATVPITGRKQLKLVPTSQLTSMSYSQYSQVKNEVDLLPDSDPRTQNVKEVGRKIADAVEKFMRKNDMADRLSEF